MLNNAGKQGASVKEAANSSTKVKARVTSPGKLPKDEERYDRVSSHPCAHSVHASTQVKATKEVATQDPYGN